jgi:hypothetical protein
VEQQFAMNACQAGRCGELVERAAIFCDRHDAMLHDELRRELLDAWRPGRPPSKRYLDALVRSRDAIRHVETTGARVPREGELPW